MTPLFATALRPRVFLIRDARRDQLLFHVEHGDYFGTLAAILGLIEETEAPAATRHTLGRIRNDLQFLQDHYRIEKK